MIASMVAYVDVRCATHLKGVAPTEPRGGNSCAIFGKKTSSARKIMGRLTSPVSNVGISRLGSFKREQCQSRCQLIIAG